MRSDRDLLFCPVLQHMKKQFIRFGKPALWLLLILVACISAYRYYKNNIGVTRLAFVNYSSFQLSRILKANSGKMIRVVSLPVEKLGKIRNYDAVFVFGRGLELNAEQLNLLKNASYTDLPVFVETANNPNFDVTNLKGKDLDQVTDYFRYGGTENYSNLLKYVRFVLDHKKWFAAKPAPPRVIPKDVFFYLDESLAFDSPEGFTKYAEKNHIHRLGWPKIVLLTSVPGPFNSNRDHLDAIIRAMEKQHWNVYPMAGATKRLEWLKKINPDLVVMMPHGRITAGSSDQTLAWLKQQNVPVLTALSVFSNYHDWDKDPQGMAGSLLSMNIALPELDGAIVPYVVAAQFKDRNGFDIFKTIPGRVEKFCSLAQKYIDLKRKPNSEKKIAVYYFKGPGMNSMTASNMEVVPSLYNMLKKLKAEGYRVDNLPADEKGLWNLILKSGSVLAPYAEGTMEQFFREGKPAWVSAGQFGQWAKHDLTQIQQDALREKYGAFPGSYMSAVKNNKDYLAVARIQLGNIVLLPQPLPAIGNNTFRLIHGAKVAPPYPYIASYLWARHAFHADAMLHFGTHGSLEFTPGKQVAQGDNDWSDALAGALPHFYVYTVSNVGEAIIAKRRSYATMLSHLTAPFMKGGTSDELAALEENLHKWTAFEKGPVRTEYGKTISQKALKLGLYKDLGADSSKTLTEVQLSRLAGLVEEIDNEKVTSGLYTLGKPYSQVEINRTVKLMAIDQIAYNLAKLDILKGLEKPSVMDNQVAFTSKYRRRADRVIGQRFGSPDISSPDGIIAANDLKRADQWLNTHHGPDEDALIRGFIAMGDRSPGKKKGGAPAGVPGQAREAEALLVKILPYPAKVKFIQELQSDKRMKDATGLLDPATLARAQTIAKAIPKMQEAITIARDRDVNALLKLMQNEKVRGQVLVMLKDSRLASRVTAEKRRIEEEIRKKAARPDMQASLAKATNGSWKNGSREELRKLNADLRFFNENRRVYSMVPPEGTLLQIIEAVEKKIGRMEENERQFAEAVSAVRSSVSSVNYYRRALAGSTSAELQSIVNALNGGYIAPSTGGDPVHSPAAIPTGRNVVSMDAEKTPSAEAWSVGEQLGKSLLENHRKLHGAYPKKVGFTLWSGDFIQTEGAMLAQIFYLLGVEPVRDPLNRVHDIRLIPASQLGRPRIDVVVQTSGQFRDLAASRISLINKAVMMAAAAPANDQYANYVCQGISLSEKMMKEKGFSPREARELSAFRVFGGVDGNYGTGIMGMVEKSDRWNTRNEIAETYINNMGAVYGDSAKWALYKAGVFEAALQQTEVVVQPRSSNTWGPLSLDHVYEFMGGISLAVKKVTGKEPDAYFSDFRNPANARVQQAKEAVWVEARSTLLNPAYIKEMLKGGASSAEQFAETFRNTFGWNVMRPGMIDQELWNSLHDVYIKDNSGLGVGEFFKKENPYALEEMTGVMLEAHRKGMWKANARQLAEVAQLHYSLLKDYHAGCSEFVCGNIQLRNEVARNLNAAGRAGYIQEIKKATIAGSAESGNKNRMLKKEGKTDPGAQSREAQKNTPDTYRWLKVFLSILTVLAVLIFLLRRRVSVQNPE